MLHLEAEEGSLLFVNKKKQKNFVRLARNASRHRIRTIEVFWFFF